MTDDMPRAVRDLVRGLDRAALATALPVQSGAWPYASLVLAVSATREGSTAAPFAA